MKQQFKRQADRRVDWQAGVVNKSLICWGKKIKYSNCHLCCPRIFCVWVNLSFSLLCTNHVSKHSNVYSHKGMFPSNSVLHTLFCPNTMKRHSKSYMDTVHAKKTANHKPVNKRKDAHNKAANKHKQSINNPSVSRVQHLFQLAHSMARKFSQSSIRVNCNLVLRLQSQIETKIHCNICYSRSVLPSFLSTHTLIEKSSYFLPDCLLEMQKLPWTVQTFGRFM